MHIKDHKKLIHFFNNVMMHLGHHNYRILFNGDNYCWRNKKLITIDDNYNGDVR